MSGLLGEHIRCPRCGAKAIDVAPDFPLSPDASGMFGTSEVNCSAKCANGHRLMLCVRSKPRPSLYVEAFP